MTKPEEPIFYDSDTPCRRCSSTLRYRNTVHKGQCSACVDGDEAERRAKNWVITRGTNK